MDEQLSDNNRQRNECSPPTVVGEAIKITLIHVQNLGKTASANLWSLASFIRWEAESASHSSHWQHSKDAEWCSQILTRQTRFCRPHVMFGDDGEWPYYAQIIWIATKIGDTLLWNVAEWPTLESLTIAFWGWSHRPSELREDSQSRP